MKKLIYIEMRWENGEAQYLEGEDAEKWRAWADGHIGLAQLRAGRRDDPGVKWKKREPSDGGGGR